MNWIIQKTIHFLLSKEAIAQEDVDVYEYGLYTLYSDILDFAVTLIIAFALRLVPHTVLYYIAFIGLRRYGGGYHASTRLRCFSISIAVWLVSLWLILLTSHLPLLSVFFGSISWIAVWLWAPSEHKNNPLGNLRPKLKLQSRIYMTAIMLAVAVTAIFTRYGLPGWVAASIAYGALSFAFSLAVAKVQASVKTE